MTIVYETNDGNYLALKEYYPFELLPKGISEYAGVLGIKLSDIAERSGIVEKSEEIEIGEEKQNMVYAHLTPEQLLIAIEADKEWVIERMKIGEADSITNKVLGPMLERINNFEKTVMKKHF